MKIRIIFITTLLVGIFSVISCDIDRVPETSLSDESFWNSEDDFEMASNYFYTTLPGLANSDIMEFTWGTHGYANKSPNNISDGSRVAPNSSDDYGYKGIFQANNIIEKATEFVESDEDDMVDEALIESYVGEARFFRAWYYFEMFKRYGGVPIITETLDIEDDEVYEERASRDEVIDLIYEDLDYAIDHLRSSDEVEYGRINNSAAAAFKARVALFEGTRSKFHEYGDSDKHLELAKEAASEVIESGNYSLYSTPT